MTNANKRLILELNSIQGTPYTQDVFLTPCEWELLRVYAKSSLQSRNEMYNAYSTLSNMESNSLVFYLMGYLDGLNPLQVNQMLKQLEKQ